jgi:hypothetical protein
LLTKSAFFCLFIAASVGQASDTFLGIDKRRLTVGAPLEVDVVGFAVGVHPELLWRPFSEDSGLRLRAASALKLGSEYTLLAPVSLGVRWQTSSVRLVQAELGTGLQWKAFLVPDSGAHQRVDWYWEAGLSARIASAHRVGLMAVPEFGLANITAGGLSGTFGLGLALRVTWSMALQ